MYLLIRGDHKKSFGNNLIFKYKYNLAFYILNGKLLCLPLYNLFGSHPTISHYKISYFLFLEWPVTLISILGWKNEGTA